MIFFFFFPFFFLLSCDVGCMGGEVLKKNENNPIFKGGWVYVTMRHGLLFLLLFLLLYTC